MARGNPNQDARSSGTGQYVRTIETATRDAEAARLRGRGRTYAQIAEELGLSGRQVAYECVQRALKVVVKEAASEALAIELDRLDAALVRLERLETAALEVMERHHITVNNGHVIEVEGEPLLDDAPVLQAIDRLAKIEDARNRNSERRSKLLGLDAAVKSESIIQQVTPQDAALQERLRAAKEQIAAKEQTIIDGGV